MGNVPRSVGGRFLLELDGAQAGFLKSVEGGEIAADVVVEPVGPERFPKKHIGTVKYEEFTLGIDLGSSSDVYTWISDSWKGQAKPREGRSSRPMPSSMRRLGASSTARSSRRQRSRCSTLPRRRRRSSRSGSRPS